MIFLGIFRSDLQKIVKKGSKFDPPGPKNAGCPPQHGKHGKHGKHGIRLASMESMEKVMFFSN